MIRWFVPAVLGALLSAAFASPARSAEAAVDSTSVRPRSGWLYVLPVVAYSPETEMAFGASAGRFYRWSDSETARPTTVSPTLIVTTADQVMAMLFGDLWWREDAWHVAAMAGYFKFPTKFYGIGDATRKADEEIITPRYPRLDLTVNRRIGPGIYVGTRLEWEHVRITDLEDGSLLTLGGIFGANGGTLVGVGAVVSYDTRNALFYPTRGSLHQLAVSRYVDGLGSDYVFTRATCDLRTYLPLGGTRVVALQGMASAITGGQAPFYQLQRIGLRGYYETRYLTTHVVLAQAELRTGLRGRLGAAVFAGVAEVGDGTQGLRLDEARAAAGFGLRFQVGGGPDRSNLRLDFGFGRSDSGVYINFGEAF